MIVTTKSGTKYQFDGEQVRRLGGSRLRRDEEWLNFTTVGVIEVGEPMVLYLEPLGEGDMTVRTTTEVVRIEYDQ